MSIYGSSHGHESSSLRSGPARLAPWVRPWVRPVVCVVLAVVLAGLTVWLVVAPPSSTVSTEVMLRDPNAAVDHAEVSITLRCASVTGADHGPDEFDRGTLVGADPAGPADVSTADLGELDGDAAALSCTKSRSSRTGHAVELTLLVALLLAGASARRRPVAQA